MLKRRTQATSYGHGPSAPPPVEETLVGPTRKLTKSRRRRRDYAGCLEAAARSSHGDVISYSSTSESGKIQKTDISIFQTQLSHWFTTALKEFPPPPPPPPPPPLLLSLLLLLLLPPPLPPLTSSSSSSSSSSSPPPLHYPPPPPPPPQHEGVTSQRRAPRCPPPSSPSPPPRPCPLRPPAPRGLHSSTFGAS